MLDLVLWFSLLGTMPLAVAIASRLVSGIVGSAAPSQRITVPRRPRRPANLLRPDRAPDRVKSLARSGEKVPAVVIQ
jgi:hypothetical protein